MIKATTPIGEPLMDCDRCGEPILCVDHVYDEQEQKTIGIGNFRITEAESILHPACFNEEELLKYINKYREDLGLDALEDDALADILDTIAQYHGPADL